MAKPVSKSSVPQRLRVLIVEHNQADMELSVKELERDGFQVSAEMAATREQFSERLAQQEYDIVLADYRLPDWTGMDALEVLQQQGKSIPFILVTGTLGEERAVECIKQGATDYVLKGHLVSLPVAVRRALEEQKLREDRARAEEALRESESKFRAVAETAACAIYLCDQSRFLYVNPASEAISGYTRQELLRMSPFDVIHPDFREKVRERTLARLRGESFPANVETPIVAKSGETRWLDFRVAVIPYEGAPAILATAFDVTERKQAEEALREKEHLLSESQRIGHIGSWRYDLTGRITWSDEMYRIYGVSPATFTPNVESFLNLIHAEDRPAMQAWIAACVAGEKPGDLAFRSILPDGPVRFISGRGELKCDADNRPLYMTGTAQDITARKQAEEALRESEERIRRLFEQASDGIFVISSDDRYLDANASGLAMLGYTREELLQMGVADALAPHEQQRLEPESGLMMSGRPHLAEWVHVRKDGSTFPGEVSARSLGGESYLAIVRDLTQRKQAEEALRESERRYRELVERSPTLICTHALDGTLQSVNAAAVKTLGYRPEEMIGRDLRDLVPAEVRSEVDGYLERIRRQYADEGVLRVMSRDGKSHFLLYRNAILEEAGRAPFVLGNAVDITDKVEAKRLLRQSEEASRSFVDNAPYGIYRVSVEGGRFISANPAMIKMLGYDSAEEVLALDLARDVYRTAGDRAKIVQALRDQRNFHDLQLLWKRKDGSDLVVRASGRIAHDPSGQEYFEVIAEDVTERRLLEQQLRQAQKMEAIGQLAGGVAHDFNNLLMAISSFSELVGGAGPTNEKQQHYLEEVLKATRRAAGLTQQLLAFSRKQILIPSVLELNAVVHDLSKMLPRLIGEHIEVRLLAKAPYSRIEADRGQIEQVLMNLAINARDAMPNGGTLVIEVKEAVFGQPHLGPNYTIPAGAYVMLAVSDSGVGMDAETQAHIFEPFFTTKERGKGTGLGLATVYGIVKQSGGYISVYSEKGVGTTFKMYFPRAEKEFTADRSQAPAQPVAGGTETILLVEDEQAVRFATREFLQTKGYTVLDAQNGSEALQAHSQHVGPVHLLITDVVMPGMNGRELAERLRQLDPGLQVLYVSGYTDGAIASVAGLEREAGFLQKPFSLEFLAQRVRAVLDAAAPKAGAG